MRRAVENLPAIVSARIQNADALSVVAPRVEAPEDHENEDTQGVSNEGGVEDAMKKAKDDADDDNAVRAARAAFAEAAARFGDENEWAAIVAGAMDDERRRARGR